MSIVICSNKSQAVHHAWARKQGADVYLTKPYTSEDLLSAIELATERNSIVS